MSGSLLNLPRSIRNIIYSHLHKAVPRSWRFNEPTIGHGLVQATFYNVPEVNIFLTHSTLQSEYRAMIQPKKVVLCATICICDCSPCAKEDEAGHALQSIEGLCQRVGELKLLHHCKGLGHDPTWPVAQFIYSSISTMLPRLQTIRVLVKFQHGPPAIFDHDHPETPATFNLKFLAYGTQAPDQFAGMPMVQGSVSLRAGDDILLQSGNVTLHRVYEIGAFVFYASGGADLWEEEEVLEEWGLLRNTFQVHPWTDKNELLAAIQKPGAEMWTKHEHH